jgi:hypothetical protein
MLRRGMTIHPHHCILSLISLSVYIKDIIGMMDYVPCIGDMKESGPLTHPSYGKSQWMGLTHTLNTLGLDTLNLIKLCLFGPLGNSLISH